MEPTDQTLLETARTIIRVARSLPPGSARNELRQVVIAIKALAQRNHQGRRRPLEPAGIRSD